MIWCWGGWRQQGPGNTVSLWTSLQEERGRQEGVGIPRLLQEVANSAPCHQQLPILGIKYTGAQELGYRLLVVESSSWSFGGLVVSSKVVVTENE